MEKPIALLDACVLYPAPLRLLLMYLSLSELFHARWSESIHLEWMRNVQANHPDITTSQLNRIRKLMDAHVPDALVCEYEELIPMLELPDPDDRHVLAAAIHAGASLIITWNLKDFPAKYVNQFGIRPMNPDEFIGRLFEFHPDRVCGAMKQQRESLINPPLNVSELLLVLQRNGLGNTVQKISKYESDL